MMGNLTSDEIDDVLGTEVTGRIGCHALDRTYIVPVNYVYDGDDIYAGTTEEMKLRMMRQNPQVCFEVDQVGGTATWRSVIAWGSYEELQGEEAIYGLRMLAGHLTAPAFEAPRAGDQEPCADRPRPIVFRINLNEKTGHCERP